MAKGPKIVLKFAVAGFTVPLVVLVFYSIAQHYSWYPSTTLLFYLCPFSIASMALDNAGRTEAIEVWSMIAAANALLYAAIGVVMVVGWWLVLKFRSRPVSEAR